MNKIFCINKPKFISSNFYLKKIKRKYKVKKAGFSGTLDPFASGNLICAFNQYTKLFRFIKKDIKRYKGVIWLGVKSDSMDIENVLSVDYHKKLNIDDIRNVFTELSLLNGNSKLKYIPPKFSAKKIAGNRAYDLARKGIDFEMKESEMSIFDLKLHNYNHPFISFEASVSEGGYIRSLANVILDRLKSFGTLSSLHRISEGKFHFNNEVELNILDYLNIDENLYLGDYKNIEYGKKLDINDFENKNNGTYYIFNNNLLSVIKIEEDKVSYELNRIEIC